MQIAFCQRRKSNYFCTMHSATVVNTVHEATITEVQPKTFEVEEQQVIVHCSLENPFGTKIRIWKTTYLLTESGHKCPLVAWRGITLAPQWMLSMNNPIPFTLIFKGLPSDCKVFSLIEDIPEENGFIVHDIPRNRTDVYRINL